MVKIMWQDLGMAKGISWLADLVQFDPQDYKHFALSSHVFELVLLEATVKSFHIFLKYLHMDSPASID